LRKLLLVAFPSTELLPRFWVSANATSFNALDVANGTCFLNESSKNRTVRAMSLLTFICIHFPKKVPSIDPVDGHTDVQEVGVSLGLVMSQPEWRIDSRHFY